MNFRACPNEAEVRQLLARGQWPHSASPELRDHVRDCRSCGDLVLVSEAFRTARAASVEAPHLPPPGVLWWRAQLRRRNAAVERVNRPIVGAQIFALAITVAIVAVIAISQARQGARWFSWLAAQAQSSFDWKILWPFASGWLKPDASLMYLLPVLGMLVLLGGVVVYFASEKQ